MPAHTSLDALYASAPGWVVAQKADSLFISKYAAQNPRREDLAESFLLGIGLQQGKNRIPERTINTVSVTMPNRIKYLDTLMLDMKPVCVN